MCISCRPSSLLFSTFQCRTYLSEHDFIALMVIQVETYFVTIATLNGIWCIVTVSDQASYSSKIAYVRLAEIAYEQF